MAVLVAWEPWRQVSSGNNVPDSVGRKLFDDFKDPLAAKSLEVVKYDEDTATIRPFKVAQINGVWSIPSHSNYPADAKEHNVTCHFCIVGIKRNVDAHGVHNCAVVRNRIRYFCLIRPPIRER